jgi:hypothetical protein
VRAPQRRIDFGEHDAKKRLLFDNNRRRAGTGGFSRRQGAVLVDFVLHDKVV